MKVWDLFPFNDELALLDLRLEELACLDARHCLVELPVTFTGLPKPLFSRLVAWTNRDLNFYTPKAFPEGPHPTVDWFQRAQLGQFIRDADPDDIVMLSDVDEIPNRETIKEVIASAYDHPVCLQQRLYYHRVDMFDPSGPWSGTIIAPRHCLGKEPDMQELRHLRCVLPQIENGGWHFSWMGDGAAIKKKLQAVDIERDSDNQMHHPSEDPDFLQSCYETGRDLFGRPEHDKVKVPIVPGVNQPFEILEWLEKHPEYGPR